MNPIKTEVIGDVIVRISWDAPYDNSNSIDQYKILIKQKNGVYSENLAYCDGSDSNIIGQQYCEIPMNVFRDAPFSLLYADTVQAIGQAKNDLGWSDISIPQLTGG